MILKICYILLSRLIQPCGLKYIVQYFSEIFLKSRLIQPCGLKWYITININGITPVEAYTALWIEICFVKLLSNDRSASRLIQPCGLKCSYWQPSYKSGVRRGLYSLVD